MDFLGKRERISLQYVKARAGDYIITAGNMAADVIPASRARAIIEAFEKSRKSLDGGDAHG